MPLRIIKPGTKVKLVNPSDTFNEDAVIGVITECVIGGSLQPAYTVSWWDEGGRCERPLERFEFELVDEDSLMDVEFE